MKKILIFILLSLFIPMFVFAGGKSDDKLEDYAGEETTETSIGCKYKVSFPEDDSKPTGKQLTDYITLYFEPGKGYINKLYVDSTKKYYKNERTLAVSDGKVFGDKPLFLGSILEFTFVFTSDIKTCPSTLDYFTFASSSKAAGAGGYVLANYNYSNDIIGAKYGTITLEEEIKNNSGKNETEKNENTRKNCGKSYVISPYGGKVASASDGYSLKVQYYLENNKKYIEITMKKGKEEFDTKGYELFQETGSYLDLDYYEKTYGLRKLRIETFGECEKASIVSCTALINDSVYIGKTCNEDASGDTSSLVDVETTDEYEQQYTDKYTPPELPMPDINKMNCTSLLGNPETEGSPAFYLKVIFNVLKYVSIIVLIVLTMLDFVGAVAAHDDDSLKKAVNKAIKRAILCVIIFVLPTLIEFVLQFIHTQNIDTCGI